MPTLLFVTRPLALLFSCLFFVSLGFAIEPWEQNPWYWSHRGQPVMLLGGSDDDNLFQWPTEKLIPQLDRIAAAGGNVVRNTMSDRKDTGFEVYPFLRNSEGKYDLDQWNPEYWSRFETFLAETAGREIFVQIEVWDRFDYTDNRPNDPKRWESHPYNPINNVNYTSAQTGLERRYPEHPGANKQPFFYSTPAQRNIEPLLKYQRAFVNRMLDASLQYDHVLYCIDNETQAEPAWAKYWTEVIRDRAAEAGQTVMLTEMWDDWNLKAPRHRQTFDYPELYDYVDVSQNNHNSGDKHWGNFQYVRYYLSPRPRPINTTKTYGSDGNKFGHSDQDAIERFWRHLLGGAASIRFHRPDSGLGINDKAVACIRAARRMTASVPVWNLVPAGALLLDRQDNEAHAAATPDRATVVVYFPTRSGERSVTLDLEPSAWQITWINIDQGGATKIGEQDGNVVSPPSEGNQVAVMRRTDRPMLAGELFEIDGHKAFAFLPAEAKRSKPQPWVLYAPTLLPNYPDEHERWLHEQLVDAGIAVAGVDVGEAYGSPESVKVIDQLYATMVKEYGFSERVCLLGRSRGGLWSVSWAAKNSERVAGLAGIYPVFDLRSYPGLQTAAPAFGMSEQALTAQIDTLNPVNQAAIMAAAKIPVRIIHGERDTVVPIEVNSDALRLAYDNMGRGDLVTIERIADQGHNYWPGFFRSKQLVQFMIDIAKR